MLPVLVGVETFNRFWHGNESAKFDFKDADLVVGDFDRIALGVYDLESETFDDGLTVPVTKTALYLIIKVGSEGVGPNPSSLPTGNITYEVDLTTGLGPVATFCTLPPTIAGGTEALFTTGTGMTDLTNFSTLDPGHLLGTIEFYAPTQTYEDFEDGWPAPTAGLV